MFRKSEIALWLNVASQEKLNGKRYIIGWMNKLFIDMTNYFPHTDVTEKSMKQRWIVPLIILQNVSKEEQLLGITDNHCCKILWKFFHFLDLTWGCNRDCLLFAPNWHSFIWPFRLFCQKEKAIKITLFFLSHLPSAATRLSKCPLTEIYRHQHDIDHLIPVEAFFQCVEALQNN